MTSMFNWLLLLGTVSVMIGLSIYSNKVMHKGGGESGFLLASNSLGPFIGASSIVATAFSGWGFMGSPGVAYKYGAIELLGNFFFAPAIVLAVLFCARFLYQKAQEMGTLTIPEYIACSHEGPDHIKRLTQGFAAITTILLLLIFLVGQIKALGLLAGQWLDIDDTTASLMMVFIIILYTSIGGLAAVAYTDTFMVMGMLGSALVVLVTIFMDLSPDALITQLNQIDPHLLSPADSGPYGKSQWHVLMVLPYAFIYSATLPYMSVRFMAFAKGTKLHLVAAYITPMACLLSLVPLVGIYMRVKMPELPNPDTAMPMFLKYYLSPSLSAVVTLFILFAMKSTANSVLHAISGAVSRDLRQAFFPKITLTSRQSLLLSRGSVIALGSLGFIIMLYIPSMMLSMLAILGSGTLMATLVAPTLLGHWFPQNIYAALSALIVGFSSGTLLFWLGNLGWVEAPLYASLLACTSYFLVGKSICVWKSNAQINKKIYFQK